MPANNANVMVTGGVDVATFNNTGLVMGANTDITLARDPTAVLHAASKRYVDATAMVINVRTFGATGNGSTDDTTSIQNAVNAAAPGNTVFFPAGTYKTSVATNLSFRISIAGAGPSSIIAPSVAGQAAFAYIAGAMVEADLTLHDIQISPTADLCVGVKSVFTKHLRVRHCVFSGCAGNAIDFDRCNEYVVQDCISRSSANWKGGRVKCYASTWTATNGGPLASGGRIERVKFPSGPWCGSWPSGPRDMARQRADHSRHRMRPFMGRLRRRLRAMRATKIRSYRERRSRSSRLKANARAT